MKQLIYGLIAVIIIGSVYFYIKSENDKNQQQQIDAVKQDYVKIDDVKNALIKVSKTSAVKSFSNPAAWYIFDMRAVYEKNDAFYTALKKEFGEDYDFQLSTGDYIFGGIMPLNNSIRVYAGDPQDENNMIYPEWKSTKIKKE